MKNLNLTLLKIIGARPIVFNPLLSKIGGNLSNGLFLSQILFWSSTMDGKEFYKTVEEFQQETGLTKDQQRRAVEKWSELGVIRVEVKGIPPKRHFWVDIEGLLAVVNAYGEIGRNISLRKNGERIVPRLTSYKRKMLP